MAVELDHYQTIVNVHWPSAAVFGYVEIVTYIRQTELKSFSRALPYAFNGLIGTPTTATTSGFQYFDGYHTGGPHIELHDGTGGPPSHDFTAEPLIMERVYDVDGVVDFPAFDVFVTGAVSPTLTTPTELEWPGTDVWVSGTRVIDRTGGAPLYAGPVGYDLRFWPKINGSTYYPPGATVNWPGTREFREGPPWMGTFARRAEQDDPGDYQYLIPGAPEYKTWPLAEFTGDIDDNLATKVPISFSSIEANGTPCTVLGYRLERQNEGFNNEYFEVYALCSLHGTLEPPP